MKPTNTTKIAEIIAILGFDCFYAWLIWGVPNPWFWACFAILLILNRMQYQLCRINRSQK